MALFSQRKGIQPLKKAIQLESLDDQLRNRLWNALKISIFDVWSPQDYTGYQDEGGKGVEIYVRNIWLDYFKEPIDTIPPFDSGTRSAYGIIREFFFKSKWWQVLDFLEFTVKNAPFESGEIVKSFCNQYFEEESAAYRFVGSEIIEISDHNEISAVEDALDIGISSVSIHFQRALELISDRKSPDYRNSIKESISAVEVAVRIISGKPKATLGDAIKAIDDTHKLHPAFKDAFSKLYGFTNDASGIRHALTEDGMRSSFADAKFMLVACSAFVNFLFTKAAELGIELEK